MSTKQKCAPKNSPYCIVTLKALLYCVHIEFGNKSIYSANIDISDVTYHQSDVLLYAKFNHHYVLLKRHEIGLRVGTL